MSEVWVRAPQVRTHVDGVVTTGNDRFPVKDGEVSFTAVPGPAVLALISQGRAVDTIPILVGDASTQSLRQVVSAAKIADDATQREIEKLAAQAVELVDSSTANARKAQDGATRAETAAGNAKQSETKAEDAARRASNSATSANRSSVWVSQAEQRAEKSASSAKADADRVANIANSTSWNGDRLTVNGKTSPSLTGPRGQQGERGPKGTVEPGQIVPLPKETIDLTNKINTNAGSGKATLVVHGGTCYLSLEFTPNSTGTSYIIKTDAIPAKYRSPMWVYNTASAVNDADSALVTVNGEAVVIGGVNASGVMYRTSMSWNHTSDVSAMSGPMGPPGEVTRAQLDTAVASEKARTVGVTWTVPRESGVAAKASAAQTGDYIQVAQTHTIYRVTSGGVEVEKYGTRTLQASTDPNSNKNPNGWVETGDPWAGVNWSRVSPPAGRWLIELINPHDFSSSLYVEGSSVGSVTKGTMSYITEFSASAKSDVYVQIPGDNHYKPLALRFTPIN
ncbi:hypothetical protein J8244_09365 [Corynebacterium tuberculostearicum]|uniref:hypothetical protein n=1 Tax=Corynebacterium tuberculostearicum TaxID=38304 RepID=UPI0026664518|nr:hypothetical protein [Corynebacterium tuberculostearicum]WKE50329.1 hypothetical protein J8244_09365 [Corynebacterium tuberculostearicum]